MVHQERCVYQAQKKERESIRQKLALGSFPDDGLGFYSNGHRTDKPDPSSRLQNGMNLQMCFINDSDRDSDQERDADDSRNDTVLDLLLSPLSRQISPSSVDITDPLEDTDFLIQQEKLRTEARLALALATPMAKMQVEVERQTRRKSPVVHLLPHISECLLKRSLKTSDLKVMTLGQLQVIVNDMHSQIESLNEELVQLLLGRDQLHVEQDAILVDIEDLTRHAESHPRVRTDKTFSK